MTVLTRRMDRAVLMDQHRSGGATLYKADVVHRDVTTPSYRN